jgi:predicted NBD/HSP70 family sugar kinase
MEQLSSGSGPHVLRWLNAAAVLTALRGFGSARVADLVASTSLTRPTVTQALAALERAGWAEMGPGEPPRKMAVRRIGRPAQQVRFRSEAGHVLGIDIGRHKLLAAVADLSGTVLAQYRRDVGASYRGQDLVTEVESVVDAALAQTGLSRASITSVAVGTPGIVSDGRILLSPSIAGWAGIPLAQELSQSFACPVLVDNDVNLAVLAERWRGVQEPVNTLVFVHWGARLGAGLMIGGRLHRGATAAAGEIGFVDVADVPTPRPGAQGLGPLEADVGTGAIARLAQEAVRRQKSPLRSLLAASPDPLDVSAVFRCATDGDAVALGIVDEIAARFARGVAPLFLLLDPDLVVIGGGVSLGGRVLLDAVDRHLRGRTLVPPPLVLSSLGDTSVALGAVRLALDDVEERLFSPAALSSVA